MATPARRSTRHSSRTASPATRRGGVWVNPADKVNDAQAMEVTVGGPANGTSLDTSSPLQNRNGQEVRPAAETNVPTTPGPNTPKPRENSWVKAVARSSSMVRTGSRSSSRQRKPARFAELIEQEEQATPIASGVEEEDSTTAKVFDRLEESGDDEYDPADKADKARNTKKNNNRDSKDIETVDRVNHRTPEGQKQLREIIDATIMKSIDIDNELLAIALKRIYNRTFTDEKLADLLDNILSQVANDEETETFRKHIKEERKKAKKDLATGKITLETALSSENNTVISKSARSSESNSNSPSKPTSPKKTTFATTPAHNRKLSIKNTPSQPAKASNSTNSTPATMAVVTRRGARRQANSPTPKSPTRPEVIILEPPASAPPTMSTRNSKKRPSSTPEPSSRQNGVPSGAARGEPPRKKAKLSGETRSNSSSALSELSASSRETSTEAPDTRSNSAAAAKGSYTSVITGGVKIGGNLKRKPEPAQKAKILAGAKHGLGLPDEEMETKRRELKRTDYPEYKVHDSFIRDPVQPTGRRPAPPPVDVFGVYTPTAREATEQNSLRSPASSSILGDFLIPPPPGAAARPSRSATPATANRRTARVKTSPIKKKNTIVASLGARAGGRDSPVGFRAEGEDICAFSDGLMADSDDQSDNVDYCVTCNESGELLCCDGCPRSFHFLCCDPPLEETNPPTGEWFCHVCENRRNPIPRPPRGLFSMLIHDVNRQNASIFHLPQYIRVYFEGVAEGENGVYSYDDPAVAKHRTRATGPSAEIEADNFKIKDSKGNFVLCTSCGKTAAGKREMIKCDHCSEHWHLDCLDPPPANPPVKPLDNRARQMWKCPAHADLDTSLPGKHRFRRPKAFRVVDTMLNRGHRNNGDIEIELESSSDEESETEMNDDGTIYRLTEKSIKLDFIERVKQVNEDEQRRQRWEQELQRARLETQQQLMDQFKSRSNDEQRAIDALLHLQQDPPADQLSNGVHPPTARRTPSIQNNVFSLLNILADHQNGNAGDAPVSYQTRSKSSNGPTAIGTPNSSPALRPEFSGAKKQASATPSKLSLTDRRALEKLQEMIAKRLEQPVDGDVDDGGKAVRRRYGKLNGTE